MESEVPYERPSSQLQTPDFKLQTKTRLSFVFSKLTPFSGIFLTILVKHTVRALFILLATVVVAPSFGQNTKGDRPVDNQRTVRETKGKTVKKRSKATTRDIAGRRLRTKNKSSANRANVGIPQPATTSRQPRRVKDTPAPAPISKRFASKEARRSNPDRAWQGDISGSKPRKIKPKGGEETGRNVYPQREYMTRRPMGDRPFKQVETHTASGKRIIKRTPHKSEKAWKGDIKGQPVTAPPSKSGALDNVFSQKTRYSKYVTKRPSGGDKSFDNKAKIAKAKRLGTNTSPKPWRQVGVAPSYSRQFITRGRKNVYWGKMKIRERARTGDLTGRPLQKRNFRSSGQGFIGTDTLAFFGRKPHGDVIGQGRKRNGKFLPGSEAKGGWSNDIAGFRLRNRKPGHEAPGTHRYSGFRSITGGRHNKPVQGKTPGIGAGAIANGLKRTKGTNQSNYQDQGEGFSGYLKSRRPATFAGSKTGGLWNNNRTPIGGKILPGSAGAAGRFSGRLRDNGKNYTDQGGGFTGYLKARKPYKFTGSASGKLWNNDRTPVGGKILPGGAGAAGRFSGRLRDNGKNYSDQGSGFTGYLKATKPYKFKGSKSGGLWNNDGTAVQGKLLPAGADAAGRFSGRLRDNGKNYSDQGSGFTGYLKATKPHKFSGSKTGGLWNNDGKSVTQLNASRGDAAAGSFQGRRKIRGQEKGKMLVIPNKLWNNNETPVTHLETTRDAARAGYFQGRRKTKEPDKGKLMSTPNVLWNNEGKATTQIKSTKAGLAAGGYQGRNKAKKKEEYPLNSSNKSWNNEGKATTQINLSTSAAAAGSFQGNSKYKKESKNRDADIESRMKLKQQYTQSPHSVEEATKKQKPELNRRANTYASGVKVIGKRKHHPNSADDAVDGLYVASARKTDYQGNVKMRKFFDRRGESPDAKFVNQGENNVKEDRTILTNMKLLWTKLFQKSESQPSNLKERSGKLRYDKGEKGLWAD